jgi:hypothetical protein
MPLPLLTIRFGEASAPGIMRQKALQNGIIVLSIAFENKNLC